jgi:hypothetical protein
VVDLAAVPGERLQIPYEGTTLPGYFFRAPDPGVVDVSTSWTKPLPGFMRAQLEDPSKRDAFDKEMGWTKRLSKSTRATLHFRGEPYGVAGDSRYDLYREVLKYRLGDEVKDVTTPLLITEPEGEQFWPGQSQALYDLLPGPRELVRFTAAEGASRHCEPMGLAVRDARVSTGSAVTWWRSRRCRRWRTGPRSRPARRAGTPRAAPGPGGACAATSTPKPPRRAVTMVPSGRSGGCLIHLDPTGRARPLSCRWATMSSCPLTAGPPCHSTRAAPCRWSASAPGR